MSKRELYFYISGICTMTILLVSYSFFTNDLPFMRAAGVGTGAPDINARYLDGYGTATTTGAANKILVTDSTGYVQVLLE